MFSANNDCGSESGALDNKIVVRFTHTTENPAGTETHLESLNRILLLRNRMKIIYLYMPEKKAVTEYFTIGKGNLIRIPLNIRKKIHVKNLSFFQKLYVQYFCFISGHDSYNPQHKIAVDFQIIIEKIFTDFKVDLAVNHFPGSQGSLLFMKEAQRRNIPVLVINHFHNRWFENTPIRKQLFYADKVAGLSNVNVPRFLEKQFVNLSNGIDTDFFNPDQIRKNDRNKKVLLLPGRVLPKKGHFDLLEISLFLKVQGFNCLTVFAGKIYSEEFKNAIDKYVENNDLSDNVMFTGMLSPEQLRQWYADSTVMVLPTYHDEGLPRVILESQAMKVPAVCYNSGGVSEAISQNITGFCVKQGDKISMRNAIVNLLTNQKKCLEMGCAGRNFVLKNFSLTAMATRHETLYSQMLHQ